MFLHRTAFVLAATLLIAIIVVPLIFINFQTQNILQEQAKFEHSTQTNTSGILIRLSDEQQTIFTTVFIIDIVLAILFGVTLWYALKTHEEKSLASEK
jgi:Ca2+/H+ antiporter